MSAAAVVAAVRAGHEEQGREHEDAGAAERGRIGTVNAGTAFYRKYTEALLRRYVSTAMSMGRSPSVLGSIMFRGKSSHSNGLSLEDSVIFKHDVENCLKKLDRGSRELIEKMTLQAFTQAEMEKLSGMSARNLVRRHWAALDRLTEILLKADLLETGRY